MFYLTQTWPIFALRSGVSGHTLSHGALKFLFNHIFVFCMHFFLLCLDCMSWPGLQWSINATALFVCTACYICPNNEQCWSSEETSIIWTVSTKIHIICKKTHVSRYIKGPPVLIQCRFPFCKMKLIVILLPLIILEGKYFLMIPLVSKSCAGITGMTTNDVDKVIRKSRSVVRGPRLATMLRLTFHDCVGITSVSLHHFKLIFTWANVWHSGGCDGCINVEDSSNNGLADLIADLEEVFQKNDFNDTLSRYWGWDETGIW